MTKQLKIGLTGSIGMGKSTTLKMFKKRKILTWCADEAITRLYSCNGAAIEQIKKISPKSVINNCVSKENLRMDVQARPHILTKIEGLVNPLIKKDRQMFLKSNSKEDVIIFDIPLLFENNLEGEFDFIITVSASEEKQKTRVLSRKTMDEKLFSVIKLKQISDKEKRQRSDFVIQTDTIDNAEYQVNQFLLSVGLEKCVK
jgi:dephospho-CoA kinase